MGSSSPAREPSTSVMSDTPGENTKPGGLTFEVVLEDAKTTEKPSIGGGAGELPSVTAKDIEKKLEESENRRKSLEAATLERLAEMERRAEEVRAKKASLPPSEETVQETE